MFTADDVFQIEQKGIALKEINAQMLNFKHGFPFAKLASAATINDGIWQFADDEIDFYVHLYKEDSPLRKITKFVPASGAATRMFKMLFEYRDFLIKSPDEAKDAIETDHFKEVKEFFERLDQFAFHRSLKSICVENNLDLELLLMEHNHLQILNLVLNEEGLNYSKMPKALLRFHRYIDRSRLALEEHLVESSQYATDSERIARIHFTVSPEHQALFVEHIHQIIEHYEKAFDVTFEIGYSIQKPSTDIIAVDMNNQPFREESGELVFRPGGHGALIQNLNDILGDIVFIKNIDNVVPDHLRAVSVRYKQVIGGLLLNLQSQIFKYLKLLEIKMYDLILIEEIENFCTEKLLVDFSKSYEDFADSEKADYLFELLNRPIRVCGMVKNEGEPGGGPFWVIKNDTKSLQIVESSQVNMKDPGQLEIFKSATHFNPVDLVCGLRNYLNEPFNLLEFIDNETGFISEKSKNGKALKAMELPGLWNGAMAKWLTVFVEVPIITFNPVKVVNDLLRPQHQ